MRPMTRRERRAERQRQYLMRRTAPSVSPDYRASGERGTTGPWDGEAPLPWWVRPLDYKVSGETGALKVPSKVRTWHLGGRANGHRPPPGQGWERSGPAYMVAAAWTRLPEPVLNHWWRRMRADQTTANTDK